MTSKTGKTYDSYEKWDKVTKDLLVDVEKEEKEEEEKEKKALGLDGKYAFSEAEKLEREKLQKAKEMKEKIDGYTNRELQIKTNLNGLLGPVGGNDKEQQPQQPQIKRITRKDLEAGKRVISINDTSGNEALFTKYNNKETQKHTTSSSSLVEDTIVLTSDLSSLESKMSTTNTKLQPKSYKEDAENDVPEEETKTKDGDDLRSIYGLIKVFVQNVHNCSIIIKCKIISGVLEISNCTNLKIIITKDTTLATVQVDLCDNIYIDFVDAPSVSATSTTNTTMQQPKAPNQLSYWGDNKEDRIFHAGVKNMYIRSIKDDEVETSIVADYRKDGAEKIGNSTEEEFQFVTSILNNQFITEKVVRQGATTGTNARAMTQRELDEEQKLREKVSSIALQKAEEMIKIVDPKTGKPIISKKDPAQEETKQQDEVVEEVYTMNIDEIIKECELNKSRGNESFVAGEYGQAILLYTLALDKSFELPDTINTAAGAGEEKKEFKRDLCYSNRAACFLKLGQHEKAIEDCVKALEINPNNIKALFRHGLALHASGQYALALPILVKSLELEPKNKQIKQAIQFCEIKLTKEMRTRQEG